MQIFRLFSGRYLNTVIKLIYLNKNAIQKYIYKNKL